MSKKQKDYMRFIYSKYWAKARHDVYKNIDYEKKVISLLTNKIEKFTNKKILDNCCGDGYPFGDFFLSRNSEYIGVDISNYLIDIAKDRTKKNVFDIQDAENLSFEDNQFDLVFCFNSLWCIPNYYLSILEMYRVCKKGGFIIFDLLNSRNKLVQKILKNIEFERKGFGRIKRIFKNIIKIILRRGNPDWTQIEYLKSNDIDRIIKLITQLKACKIEILSLENKVKIINNPEEIKDYSKLIISIRK